MEPVPPARWGCAQPVRPARWAWALASTLALVLGASACGGQQHHSTRPPPRSRHTVLNVYASLPLHGSRAVQGRAVLRTVKLAYAQAHGRAGVWRVRLIVRDDSSASSGGWNADKTARNARRAASDPHAIFYIGELDSAASEISGPILNVAGVPQVSPLSTYVELTSSSVLDPTGRPTFLRLDPSDFVQAGAQLEAATHAGCTRVAIVHDDTLEGTGLAAQLVARRGQYGIAIASNELLKTAIKNIGAYVAALRAQSDRCVIFAGASSPGALTLLSNVAIDYPRLVRTIGPDSVCTEPFTSALPSAAIGVFRCTSPAGDLRVNAEGRSFLAAFRGATPDPLAVYGYEAMKLAIHTIAELGARGDDRDAVRDALFTVRGRRSAIGTYGFGGDGSSTAGTYGVYDVAANGAPAFLAQLTP